MRGGVKSHMVTEKRTVYFDNELKIEAYHFEGLMQKFPNHFHDYYVVGFVESGHRFLTCKNKEYTICTGDILIFNPADNHACEQIDEQMLTWRCLNIGKDIMRNMTLEITGKDYLPHFTLSVVRQSCIVPLLKDLHEMIMKERKDFNKEETFYFLLEYLIADYAEDPEGSSPMSNDSKINGEIKKICDYMESNYSETITLDDLSQTSGVNKYTLLRAFTKQRGITPYQYFVTIRVNKAKRLLEQGVPPIEAAIQSGFTDQSHFTHFFKNFIGLTPKQYQNIFVAH